MVQRIAACFSKINNIRFLTLAMRHGASAGPTAIYNVGPSLAKCRVCLVNDRSWYKTEKKDRDPRLAGPLLHIRGSAISDLFNSRALLLI